MPNPLNVPITPPRVAFIDSRTGTVSREWYMFFLSLFSLTSGSSVSLDDLQKAPPAVTIDEINNAIATATTNLAPSQDGLIAQVAELQKQVEALAQQPTGMVNQVAELQKQVEGLQMSPPPREFKRSRYGSFYDTTTQTALVTNTATAITYDTTDLSYGVYLGTPTSRVYVDTDGIYNFQTSIQLDSSVATAENFYLWFRLNGVDVTNSASQLRVQGNNAEVFVALNFFFNLKAGDYVEMMYSVSDLGVQLLASGAVAPHPGIPSVILTVANNIEGVQ